MPHDKSQPPTPPPRPRSSASVPGAVADGAARRGLALHWISWIFALAVILPGVVLLVLAAARSAEAASVGEAGGRLVAACIVVGICYLLAWAVQAISRGSKPAANITFCLLCSVWLAVFVARLVRAEAVTEGQAAEPTPRQIVLQQGERQWGELALHYLELTKPYKEAGGADVATITSVDDIAFRLQELAKLKAANEEMTAYFTGFESRTAAAFAAAGLPADEAAREARLLRDDVHADLHLRVRDIDRRIWESSEELLRFFRETWGEWQYEVETGTILLPTDEAIEIVSRLQTQIDEAMGEQTRLTLELLRKPAPK